MRDNAARHDLLSVVTLAKIAPISSSICAQVMITPPLFFYSVLQPCRPSQRGFGRDKFARSRSSAEAMPKIAAKVADDVE